MKVLMFGWEYPPHVYGGLATANFGITEGLHAQGDVDITLCLPHPFGDEDQSYCRIVAMNRVPIVWRDVDYGFVEQRLGGLMTPDYYYRLRDHIYADFGHMNVNELGAMEFAGGYPANLHEEINNYSIIAGVVARTEDFDIIHAHDWLTYLAGVEVKKATGKPLVVHLHASQFDRAGADARGWIYDIEKFGMEQADAVIPVSKYTGTIASGHYAIDPHKIFPIHNGADPVKVFKGKKKFPEKLVLFLGRLTAQKGPGCFLQIAAKVLEQTDDVRFVMAGTGEKLRQLIESGAFKGVGDKFHFTGFLNKDKVNELLSITDIYCMPSVSEPFGLSALEAAQFNIPAVISKQSGVAEVMKGALKADFWDVNKMAEHIVHLCTDEELYRKVVEQSTEDIKASTWDAAADKVIRVYEHVLNR